MRPDPLERGISPSARCRKPGRLRSTEEESPGRLKSTEEESCDDMPSKPSKRPLNWLWRPYRDDYAMDTKTDNGIPWLMVRDGPDHAADIVLIGARRYKICNYGDKICDKIVMVQQLGYRSYRVFPLKAGTTFLSARDSRGEHQAFLEVSVKSPELYKVAFYSLSDSDPATGKEIHRAGKRDGAGLEEMVQGANDIIQPQANVSFQIVQHVHGGKATSIKSVKFARKLDAVVSDQIFNDLPKYINPAADFHVFFVWAFQGSKEGSDDLAGTEYIGSTGFCLFEDGIPHRQEAQVLAHEAVHYLLYSFGNPGDHHKNQRLGDLMYPRIGAFGFASNKRLGRIYADAINPWHTLATAS